MLKTTLYTFDQLSNRQLYEILRLRAEVFVVEQKCAFQDLDSVDYKSLHILGHDDTGQLVAYSRIIPPGELYEEASIGRVVVALSKRNLGCGQEIFAAAAAYCTELFPGIPVRLMAQQYLHRFYSGFGYQQVSEPFLEDDIWHIYMVK